MRMDSEMIGILLSDSMHYTIVVSLEMSDEPNILAFSVQKLHFSRFLRTSNRPISSQHTDTPQVMNLAKYSRISQQLSCCSQILQGLC